MQAWPLPQANKVRQQISYNECQVPKGCFFTSTLQISHRDLSCGHSHQTQGREFWEMQLGPTKVMHDKATKSVWEQ